MNWPDRCRTWFFGAGGTLDHVSGKCRWTDEQLKIPVNRLQHYIDAAQQGTFVLDREKDELTMALGNPEHPGRTRGTPGSVPWKAGFPGRRLQMPGEEEESGVDPTAGAARKGTGARGTRSRSQQTTCRSFPRNYPAISAEKQRGFHRAASTGACLDNSW